MACDAHTPWSILNHPHAINRLRVTGGGATSQSTGEWVSETTSSVVVCGYIGRGTTIGATGMFSQSLERMAAGIFKAGDQMFICHSDCDVELNDIIERYDDAAGATKTYWRVVTKLKDLTTFDNLRGYGQQYFLIRREER